MFRPLPTTLAEWHRFQPLDQERVALGRHMEAEMDRLGLSEKQYAVAIERPRAFVQQHRLLARAVPELQEALTNQAISFTAARVISRRLADSPGLQRLALAWVVAEVEAGHDPTEDVVDRYVHGLLSEQVLA